MPRAENHLKHSFTDEEGETYTASTGFSPHLIQLSVDAEDISMYIFKEDVERLIEILRKAAADQG